MLFFITKGSVAQTINIGGSNWNINTSSSPSLVQPTEAGNDYSGTYESSTNMVILSGSIPGSLLSLLSGGIASVVSVSYTPNNWHNNLKIFVRRSGGSASISGICVLCSSSINGGTTYIEVPQSASIQFFTINFSGLLGVANSITFSGVNVQLQIKGVSVTVPVANYNASVVYTISAP